MIHALAIAVLVFGAAHKKSVIPDLKKDFAAGEFERVIKRADAALKSGGEPRDLAQLQVWRGQALLALGREDAAGQAFTSAVEAWPDVELDAQRASPDAVRVFEKARRAVPATLAVSVAGGDATVRVDDKDLGPAPLVTQLPAGKHTVFARGSGELSATSEVELKPGKKHELALELKAPPPPPAPVEPKPEPVVEKPAPAPVEPIVTQQPAPPVVEERPSRVGLVPLIAGLAIGAAGGLLLWQALEAYRALDDNNLPSLTPEQADAARRNGPVFQATGWAAVGVGALGTVAGIVMLVLAPSAPAQAGAFIVPGGAGVSVSARWP